MILIEKQQKYQHYHLAKLINININIINLNIIEVLPPDQSKMIEQAKFTYCPSGKAFKKQTKKLRVKEEKK